MTIRPDKREQAMLDMFTVFVMTSASVFTVMFGWIAPVVLGLSTIGLLIRAVWVIQMENDQ